MGRVWREVVRASLLLQHWLNWIILKWPHSCLFLGSWVNHMPNKEEPLAGLSSLISLAKIESTIIRYVLFLVNFQSSTHSSKSSSFYIHVSLSVYWLVLVLSATPSYRRQCQLSWKYYVLPYFFTIVRIVNFLAHSIYFPIVHFFSIFSRLPFIVYRIQFLLIYIILINSFSVLFHFCYFSEVNTSLNSIYLFFLHNFHLFPIFYHFECSFHFWMIPITFECFSF